jgi:hypothetical protein
MQSLATLLSRTLHRASKQRETSEDHYDYTEFPRRPRNVTSTRDEIAGDYGR